MDLYITLLLVIIGSYLLMNVLTKNRKKTGRKLPPSLPSIPLLGSLPFFSKPTQLHLSLTKKIQRYGNVYSFMAGSKYTVVLNGYDVIHEALIKKAQDFAGRGVVVIDKHVYNKESRGIAVQSGEQWRTNRSHSLSILKQFGYGDKTIMEERIQGVVEEFIQYIKEHNGNPLLPSHMLVRAAAATINRLMFSDNKNLYNQEDENLISLLIQFARALNPLYDAFPWLVHIPPFKGQVESFRPSTSKFEQLLQNKIEESTKQGDECNNFVQQFIQMSVSTGYDVEELKFVLRDMFVAGTDTVATSLTWALAILCNEHSVMERLQKEIDSAVPRERLPSLYDKNNLPYLEATLLEVQRYKTMVPLALPHTTTCDTNVAGFDIPNKTTVIVNLWSAHMDPGVWKDPETFDPDRFLDENLNVINQNQMIGFSLGKRACLGELLARQQMFLLLAAMLQQFTILPSEGVSRIPEEARLGIVLSPLPFELRFIPRCVSSQ